MIKDKYKRDNGIEHDLRIVDFKEAYPYGGQIFKILNYYHMMSRIFRIEYLMGRNNA